ncbi:hypothetical protein AMAG_02845 [Allomyces macrogynus ATCC 38327]|uniref:Uncharacterized protein n=1 Tax=Allomyces macrogynus (strain ATCC 38327) TaxID=578462 RepID=A0A0L0S3W1_ALLM3|nr:hypothetical protein AMAG_02845 [Allomyces macrogynus ATCC 38327]|eukprot:KNE57095.1 hypothetical protein AMAG_02845 [Allomyces macrogynus ATCC 38327]
MSMYETTSYGTTTTSRQPGMGIPDPNVAKYTTTGATPGSYPAGEYTGPTTATTTTAEYGGPGESPGVGYSTFGGERMKPTTMGAGETMSKMPYAGVGMPTGHGAGIPPLGAEQPSMATTTTPRVYAGESVLDQVFWTAWNMLTSVLGTVMDTVGWAWRPLRDTVWSTASWTAATVQSTLAQFPMLRAFVYLFGLITAIPLGIFATYAAISLGICLTIAAVGVGIVEGIALGIGLLVLGPILFFSFWGTLLALGVYYASYYALNLASSSIGTAQQMGIAPTGPITGMVKEMSAETARGLQGTKEMLVGA